MKRQLLTLLIVVLIPISLIAQQGINYKALIKDNLGNVVASQTIDVRFTVIADTGPTNVYLETHTGATTDANGIIILNIGNGTTSDVFIDIAWGNDVHSLKVEIDIEQDASFVDMGTTQFRAVPYALSVATSGIPAYRINNLIDGKSDIDGSDDGSSVFLGIDAGLNDDGSGNANVGIGFKALYSNTTGFNNTAIGNTVLYNNTTGFHNVANGYQALFSNTTGSNNTATGLQSLWGNTTGINNTATGFQALESNLNGWGNSAFGSEALLKNISGWLNLAAGRKSLSNNIDGILNTAIGAWALEDHSGGDENTAVGFSALNSDTNGARNTAIGARSMELGDGGDDNTGLGFSSLNNNTGISNTAIGSGAMTDNLGGSANSGIGWTTLYSNTSGSSNTAIGGQAMTQNKTGMENVAIGNGALYNNIDGNQNTIIGVSAGFGAGSVSYSGNVFLGYNAGRNELSSNRLYIDNSNTSTPLIYGEFDNNLIKINGNQEIVDGKLNIQSIGDGNELLRFSTERPWLFRQSATGANTRLTMNPTFNGKIFEIVSSDLTNRAAVFDLWNGTSKVLLVPDNGHVGIGTDSPDANNKLHVTSDGATQVALYGSSTGENSKGIWARTSGTGSSANAILAQYLGGGAGYAGWFSGNVTIAGTLSKTAGTFKIDHPLDPENKYLYHSFVESPDMMNIYNGNITTDIDGRANVTLPDYFSALNVDFRYQLTVIGTFAQAIISNEIESNQFEIMTDKPNVKVSWQVTGIRHDAYAKKNRIQVEVEKEPENKGKYLNPEAFDLPREKSIGYIKAQKKS